MGWLRGQTELLSVKPLKLYATQQVLPKDLLNKQMHSQGCSAVTSSDEDVGTPHPACPL